MILTDRRRSKPVALHVALWLITSAVAASAAIFDPTPSDVGIPWTGNIYGATPKQFSGYVLQVDQGTLPLPASEPWSPNALSSNLQLLAGGDAADERTIPRAEASFLRRAGSLLASEMVVRARARETGDPRPPTNSSPLPSVLSKLAILALCGWAACYFLHSLHPYHGMKDR